MVALPEINKNTQDTWNISGIVVRDRKRPLGDISSLAQSINELGLLNPITITADGVLVAGYHRLEACKSLGWRFIPVHVVSLDGLNAELAEIDENLMRNELHWFDRDKQLLRRKEIYQTLHPETKRGNTSEKALLRQLNKVNPNNSVTLPTFSQDTANKANCSVDAIEQSIQRAVSFTDEQGEILKQASVKPTEATKLARMKEADRAAVIEVLAGGKTTSVKAAELAVIREKIDAQAQAAPTKPSLTLASWDTWLPQQSPCDLLITDPPYSTDVEDIDAFARSWLPVALSKVKDSGRAYVCIGAYPRELSAYLNVLVPSHLRLLQVLVWTYENTLGPSPANAYKQNWQAILYYVGLNAPKLDCPIMNEQFSVQEINAPDGRLGDRYHAWQKPDELAGRLIKHSTKPGDTVLDCFAGTGTFLLAAHKYGRVASGCDVSTDMLRIAERRGCEIA